MRITSEQLRNIAYDGYDRELRRAAQGKPDIDLNPKMGFCHTCKESYSVLSMLSLSDVAAVHEDHILEIAL
jgi:hypothetical protein